MEVLVENVGTEMRMFCWLGEIRRKEQEWRKGTGRLAEAKMNAGCGRDKYDSCLTLEESGITFSTELVQKKKKKSVVNDNEWSDRK